jgi:hypothetical protein
MRASQIINAKMKDNSIDFDVSRLIQGMSKSFTTVEQLNNSTLVEDEQGQRATLVLPRATVITKKQTASVSLNYVSNQTNQSTENKCKEYTKKTVIVLSSLYVAAGSGMALMPLLNEELKTLENFNINIDNHPAWLILSTVNTGLLIGSCAGITSYHALTHEQEKSDLTNNQKLIAFTAKAGAAMSTLLQLGLMWNIEIENQKIEGSSGFDQFMAWATFSTAPLVIYNTIEGSEKIKKILSGEDHQTLNSLGEKLVVYGIAASSFIPRAIAYTAITKEVSEHIGLEESPATAAGIGLGGVLAASFSAIVEYASLKEIFKNRDEPYSLKEKLLGALSSVEGAWFSLATISKALKSVPDWNALLDGSLFFPYFVSRTVHESASIFDTFFLLSEHEKDKFVIESEVIGDIQSDE